MVDSNKIMAYLQRISETLIFHSSFLDDIGLFNGKMGIAIFFFHLARKTGIVIYEEYACDLIEQIYESIHENMPVGYADGVAGIGVGMEYLIRHKFINANADEMLEDVDKVIFHHTQYHLPSTPEINIGITGFGKYCAVRFFSRTHVNDDGPCKNQLFKIIQELSVSYNNYDELLSVIHFLAGIVSLKNAPDNINIFLNETVNHLETKLLEDIRYGVFPNRIIQLLSVAATIVQVSEKTGDNIYSDKAYHCLQLYKPALSPHLYHESQSDKLTLSFLYQYLGQYFGENTYLQLSEEGLNDYLTQKLEQQISLGLIDGYAGMGMHLLFLSGQSVDNYFDIIPCYFNYLKK